MENFNIELTDGNITIFQEWIKKYNFMGDAELASILRFNWEQKALIGAYMKENYLSPIFAEDADGQDIVLDSIENIDEAYEMQYGGASKTDVLRFLSGKECNA